MTTTNLLMYVDGVESPLVVLQDRRGRHRFIVLGADDDDDQVALLCEAHNMGVTMEQSRSARVYRCLVPSPR